MNGGVLFLADHLGHPGGAVHGVTTYLLQVLPALRAAGVPVGACFLREPHPAAAQLARHEIPIAFLSAPPLDPRVVARVAQLIEQGGYTILHATQFKSSLLARLLAHRMKRTALVHVHDMVNPPPQIRLLTSMVARRQDCGICTSWATLSLAVRGYRLDPDRVRVLYPGVDGSPFLRVRLEDAARLRQELGIAPATAVVGMIARFYPIKGHRAMLRIFAALVPHLPDCVLLLAGEGPERLPCERLAVELGVAGKVRFLGNRSDVPEIAAAADVIVVPSQSEGLGLAAVEANLCGRPVVAYRTGGLPEVLISEACGYLVPHGDSSAFVHALHAVLCDARQRAPDQVELRRNLAVRRFGLDAHVRQLTSFYGEVGL